MSRVVPFVLGMGLSCTSFAIDFQATTDPPYYFSSTNCRASGSFALPTRGTTERGIAHYKLEINGEVVFQRDPAPGSQYYKGLVGTVTFDSTHFLDGQTVLVKAYAKAKHQDGHVDADWTADGGYTSIVKNVAVAHDMANPGPACSATQYVLQPANWAVSRFDGGWSSLAYVASLSGKAITVVGAHGFSACGCAMPFPGYTYPGFTTGVVGDHVASHNDNGSPGVYENRLTQMGTGFYHLNSTQVPPIFFTLHAVCSTGWTNHFAQAGVPFYNIWGDPASANQALLGFAGLFNGTKSFEFVSTFFEKMLEGRSAWAARDQMIQDMNNNPFSVFTNLVQVGGTWEPMSVSNTRIWGDFATKVKGVYHSDCLQISTGWYR